MTLVTNGPALEFAKRYHTIDAPKLFLVNGKRPRLVELHKFWFVPTAVLGAGVQHLDQQARGSMDTPRPLAIKLASTGSPFWRCAATKEDLRTEEFLISVEYRLLCETRQHGHDWELPSRAEVYKGRWRFMSFKADAPVIIDFFKPSRNAWDGQLEMWDKQLALQLADSEAGADDVEDGDGYEKKYGKKNWRGRVGDAYRKRGSAAPAPERKVYSTVERKTHSAWFEAMDAVVATARDMLGEGKSVGHEDELGTNGVLQNSSGGPAVMSSHEEVELVPVSKSVSIDVTNDGEVRYHMNWPSKVCAYTCMHAHTQVCKQARQH